MHKHTYTYINLNILIVETVATPRATQEHPDLEKKSEFFFS